MASASLRRVPRALTHVLLAGAALLAISTAPVAALARVDAPPAAQLTADDYRLLHPGVYTDREAPLVAKYFADNQALKDRGPIDVKALVAGTLPKDTPGLGPVIKVTEDWVRYNNRKYDPDSALRNDAAYARSLGYEDILAYPTFGAHDDSYMAPWPPGARDKLLVSELNHSVTNLAPIYPGDTLYLVMNERTVLDLTPQQGSITRNIVIQTKGEVFNQKGVKVSDVIFRVTENVKVAKPGKEPKDRSFPVIWQAPDWFRRPAHVYTDQDWAFIKDIWSKETRRGAAPLYWDDVKVGDKPAWTLDGPIEVSVAPIPPWGMGAGGSRTLKREIMDPKLAKGLIRGEKDGIWRLQSRADYVPVPPPSPVIPGAPTLDGGIDTTNIHKEGAKRAPLVNYLGRDLAIRALTNWAGDRAWLENIRWTIMDPRGMADVGDPVPSDPLAEHFLDRVPSMKGRYVNTHGLTQDVAIVKSEVVGKYIKDGKPMVDLVWWVETIDGYIFEEGMATYRLALKP